MRQYFIFIAQRLRSNKLWNLLISREGSVLTKIVFKLTSLLFVWRRYPPKKMTKIIFCREL